ncbi:MAG: TolC family protein [Gemmatimonadales bacterium]
MAVLGGLVAAALLIGPADTLSLDGALAAARANRRVLVAAAAGVSEARGRTRVAGTVPNPIVALSYTGSPPRRHVTLDQPLGWLARRSAERGAAAARVDRAVADSAQVAADLRREVQRAFFGALAAGHRVAALQEQRRLADSLVVLGRRRVAVGDIAPLELEQTIQEAARAALAVNRADEDRAIAMTALARTLGVADTAAVTPVGDLAAELDGPPVVASGSIRDLPGVRAAVADSAAAARTLMSAARSRVPAPSFQVGVEWDDPAALDHRSFLTVGVAFPFPLWNIGRGGAVAAARGAAGRAAAVAAETELEFRRLVQEQVARVDHRARRARLGRDNLRPSAERLRVGTIAQYASGRATVLAVFEALRAERDITLTLIDDVLAFQEARADLDAILGRSD